VVSIWVNFGLMHLSVFVDFIGEMTSLFFGSGLDDLGRINFGFEG